jgi:hypothetical protein
MWNPCEKRTLSRLLLASFLSIGLTSCGSRSLRLPGEIVGSADGVDEIIFSNGIETRKLRIKDPFVTGHVYAAQKGADGKLYGMSYEDIFSGIHSHSLVRVNPDGSTIPIFAPKNSLVLDFGVVPEGLIALVQGTSKCPEIIRVPYDGKQFARISTSCSATKLAASPSGIIVSITKQEDAGADLFLLRKDRYEHLASGGAPAWINANEFMYQGPDGCIWRRALDDSSTKIVLCGFFARAASPDGRFVAIVAPSQRTKEANELRILDTLTGRYISLQQTITTARAFWDIQAGGAPLTR